MIIYNQIEHLKKLNENLQYKEVIQYAKITLHITLEKKRYAEALSCYELLANAAYGVGDIANFCRTMLEYEKLCLIHGKKENKMTYFYLLSTLKSVENNEESIEASKKSIQYASALNQLEFLAVNYANIAAQLAILDQFDQAKIAAQLANYYKMKIRNTGSLKVKVNMGLVYYYAVVGDSHQFKLVKNELLQFIREGQLIYHAQIAFSEATILAQQQEFHLSGIKLQKAYEIYKEQKNTIKLRILSEIIQRYQLQSYFKCYDELLTIIHEVDVGAILYKQIQSISSDDMELDVVSATFAYKYPKIHTKKSMEAYVNELMQANKNVYCLHWCFITDEISELFGALFVEQLLFELFDSIYKKVTAYRVEFLVYSHKEGEFIVEGISNEEFFTLIMELEQQLQSSIVHLKMGSVGIPIHFGFAYSEEYSKDELTYERLIAHADARLYYAKSHGQLYMYS
ncbi:hypothetical protein [Solibacillus sp. FSL K6-1523]|uniref:hypothetical protein n=1 Tax=Solibacillus sp. FSL K6-1523 TaxID=2921471 RepID=UPI0030F6FF3F